MIATSRPACTDLPFYYHGYVAVVEGKDIADALLLASTHMHRTLDQVPEGRGDHRYAPDKWTIKEVLQHVIDAERVFAYRALRFGRNDATELPGFEENDYAPASRAHRRTMADLLKEHDAVRASSLALFESFDAEALASSGIANGHRITVNAIGWVIAGHAFHHVRMLKERYL